MKRAFRKWVNLAWDTGLGKNSGDSTIDVLKLHSGYVDVVLGMGSYFFGTDQQTPKFMHVIALFQVYKTRYEALRTN